MKAPLAKKIPYISKIHNVERVDNYHWMRLSDEQKNSNKKDATTKQVIKYIKEENNFTKHHLKTVDKLKDKVYKEIVSRIKKDDKQVPYKYNGVWYITKFKKGKEYPFYYRRIGSMNAKEELLIDVNKLAEGHSFFNLRFNGMMVSPDNNWLIYTVDKEGRNNFEIHFYNLKKKQELNYIILNTDGDVQWANDNNTIFYIKNNKVTLLADKVYRHFVGNSEKQDKLVYELKDKSYYIGLQKSKSLKYIFIGGGSTLANDFLILDANKPLGRFKRFTPKLKKHKYDIDHLGDRFIIKTNWKSKNNSIMIVDEKDTNRKYWKQLIPYDDSIFIKGFEMFNNHIVLLEQIGDLTKIKIKNLKSKESYYLKFDEPAYFTSFAYNVDDKADEIRYAYGSFITPMTIFSYNFKTRKRTILKRQEVVGEYNKKEFTSKRIYAISRDGKKIPISLVYKKDVYKKNGKLLLDGYGSYGYINDPYFSPATLSLLNRGFCYAIAHIRGSKIYGESWYEDGKMLNKKNTFNDFIDSAKFLISKKYTTNKHLYAEGASAGGLLMGAVLNDSSNLFNGVIAGVPFVDVVNTMLDDSIPLTTGEYDEWGNPNIKKYFDYMLSYSPYDNVREKAYSNILVTSGYFDSQVQYWEPLKWVAKLRDFKKDDNLLLLDMNMDAGHSGTTGRFKYYKKVALKYSFLFKLENINK